MSTVAEGRAYGRAAEVAMRAGRRREERRRLQRHAPELPPLSRTIEVTEEWLRRADRTLVTLRFPHLVMHASDGDYLYEVIREDIERQRWVLRQVDRP